MTLTNQRDRDEKLTRGALVALLLGLAACGGAKPTHTPIVVVTIDTLRADRLSCYGYGRETSPNLDRLAAESILFENASTTIATTLPAHISLWTSRYPIQTGIVANDTKFNIQRDSDTPLFAQLMQSIGYRTAAFVSATPVKKITGLGVGFEFFDEPEGKERTAEVTTDNALVWIGEHADEPFFLWVHYFDPHYPYEPPAPFHLAFKTDDVLREYMRSRHFGQQKDPLLIGLNNQYDGEILYTDHHLQRLFDGLREHGIYEAATIVVTADHGEGLGQRWHMGHGRIYEEHTHVPLILKLPAALGHAPERRQALVSIVDIVPTLIVQLDLGIPLGNFEGADMLSVDREFVFAQRSFAQNQQRWGEGKKYTLKTPRWKYHHSTEAEDELYDLQNDPYELSNRLGHGDASAGQLLDRLQAYIGDLAQRGSGLEILRQQDPDTLKDLEKLGYLGGTDDE